MKQTRTLIIDGQLLQTDAWDRGMGKYMLQLLRQLSEQAVPSLELVLLLNENIKTPPARFEALDYHCPNFSQHSVDLPVPTEKWRSPKKYIAALDASLSHWSDQNTEITFMLSGLFTFNIFAEYPTVPCIKTMVFYDLIPLMHWKDLGGYFPPDIYMERFERIYESDMLFCISETTRRDLIYTFGLNPQKTCTINGGFTAHDLPPKKPADLELPQRFVLLPTGSLPHKNNALIFAAFREVQKRDKDIHLVVTSKFSDRFKNELLSICSERVIFSQNVSDEELQYLYKQSAAVIFGSKYEGLGLPVLDAVMYDKPVVASDIPVFAEMTDNAFYFFDVTDAPSAANAIERAIEKNDFAVKQQGYDKVLKKYSWEEVGRKVLNAIRDLGPSVAVPIHQVASNKHARIGIVSINPGFSSNVSRLTERLFGRLRHDFTLVYFFDGKGLNHSKMERPTFLDHLDVEVYDINRLSVSMYRDLDHVFYFVDDSSFDYMIASVIASLPGNLIADKEIDGANPTITAVSPTVIDYYKVDAAAARTLEDAEIYVRRTVGESSYNEEVSYMKSHASLRRKRHYLKGLTGERDG